MHVPVQWSTNGLDPNGRPGRTSSDAASPRACPKRRWRFGSVPSTGSRWSATTLRAYCPVVYRRPALPRGLRGGEARPGWSHRARTGGHDLPLRHRPPRVHWHPDQAVGERTPSRRLLARTGTVIPCGDVHRAGGQARATVSIAT